MSRCVLLLASGRSMTLVALVLALLFEGCGERPLKVGVPNWIPQSTGGPIETRPLPPAQVVYSDYQRWLESQAGARVRLYEIALRGQTNQLNYTVRVEKGDTPLGATYFTDVTFIYRDPTNGQYQLEWGLRGKHKPDFLKLNARPKRVSQPSHRKG